MGADGSAFASGSAFKTIRMHSRRWARRTAVQSARWFVAIASLHISACAARRGQRPMSKDSNEEPASAVKNRGKLGSRNTYHTTSANGNRIIGGDRLFSARTVKQTLAVGTLQEHSSKRQQPLSRVCGRCSHRAATFGVVVGPGSAERQRRWATALCRLCVPEVANCSADGNSTRALRLAGRCAECSKFAIFGPMGGTRRHCRYLHYHPLA